MKKGKLIRYMLCALLVTSGRAHALSGTEITVLKIGKADAIVVSTARHTVLIDTGEDEDAGEILRYLEKKKVSAIDVLVITHFDKDHVGGADGVLAGIPIGAVYDAAYEPESGEYGQYGQYVDAVAKAGTPRHRVTEETTLALGDLTLTLMPTALAPEDDNNQSLALSMADAWHTFFFAGDAEEARIDELLAAGLAPHDFVKLPHHGAWKDNLPTLVDALSPQIAVATDSDKNPMDDRTLELLAEKGVRCCRTKDGDIRVVSGPGGLAAMQ